MDCQVECQAAGSARCEAELQGGCELQCEEPEGAIFCDGEYVDHGGHAEECIDALNAFLESHVQASSSASCSGNSCEAEAKASCQCSVPGRRGAPTWPALVAAALAALAGAARRRRV
jgi:MYXO-CTERM domain-containing protein